MNMKQLLNSAAEPIEALFSHINSGILFDTSIPEAETMEIICKNQGFGTVYDGWKSKAHVDKTWDNLKSHFSDADIIRQGKLDLQEVNAPYRGAANSVITHHQDKQVQN
jgi:hypothetical protein